MAPERGKGLEGFYKNHSSEGRFQGRTSTGPSVSGVGSNTSFPLVLLIKLGKKEAETPRQTEKGEKRWTGQI
jgi:hypothetical protein